MIIVVSTTIHFDSHGTTTAEVTCVPSQALLERVIALPGHQELTIEAPLPDGASASPWSAGEAVLRGVIDGTVKPTSMEFEVRPGLASHRFGMIHTLNAADLVLARDGSVPFDGFRRGDLVALRPSKPAAPLCRWAAIKPGQPWRLT